MGRSGTTEGAGDAAKGGKAADSQTSAICTSLYPYLLLQLKLQNADNDLWENNRLTTSGVQRKDGVDLDFEDDQDSKVHVLVHDLKPPFLDGTVAYTRQLEPINPVRDPTSDLAVFSKKGSALVRERRERQEREKAAAKAASIAGTTLGNLMGVKDEPELGEGEFEGSWSLPGLELT